MELAKDLQDRLSMGRAYCNLGLSHLALGNFQAALECQRYFLAVAQMMKHLQVSMFCKTRWMFIIFFNKFFLSDFEKSIPDTV